MINRKRVGIFLIVLLVITVLLLQVRSNPQGGQVLIQSPQPGPQEAEQEPQPTEEEKPKNVLDSVLGELGSLSAEDLEKIQEKIDELKEPYPTHEDVLRNLTVFIKYIRKLKKETNEKRISELRQLLFPWIYKSPGFDFTWEGMQKKTSGGGRGIVVSLPGRYFLHCMNLLKSLELVGCNLPIQLWHDGMSKKRTDFIKSQFPKVEIFNLFDIISRDSGVGHWETKVFVMLASNFDEPMIVDSDVLFFKNPEELYEQENYTKYGTSFWYDRTIPSWGNKQEWLRKFFPPPYSKQLMESRWFTGKTGYELESGVLIINKLKHLFALLTICDLNLDIPKKFLHNHSSNVMLWGDKERFWLGMDMADEEYGYYPTPAGSISFLKNWTEHGEDEICGRVCHIDTEDNLFWINDGILINKDGEKLWKANLTHHVTSKSGFHGFCDRAPLKKIPAETLERIDILFKQMVDLKERTRGID